MGYVMTVRGPVVPETIGVTMIHEHLIVDLSCNFVGAREDAGAAFEQIALTSGLIPLVRQRPFGLVRDNVVLEDEQLAIEELKCYRQTGGTTVVECTTLGIGRDPQAMQRIAAASNVNVVMGTGVYTENAHPSFIHGMTADDLADLFSREISLGVGTTGVRAGIIGEIGTSASDSGGAKTRAMSHEEEKVLRGAGRASARTGAAVNVHVDRRARGAGEVVDVLESEGVPPSRMVMGHMDLVGDLDYHRDVAERGVFVAFDSFGHEGPYPELGFAGVSDTWRVDALVQLVEEGFADQLVLAQDVCLKMHLRRYGGPGYGHVMDHVIPKLRGRGVSEEAIATMLVANPRRLLTIGDPAD